MVNITVAELAAAVAGELVCGDPWAQITSVSTDTRTLQPGDFFIPLVGERVDGHDFIDEALKTGAAGFITQRSVGGADDNVAVVRVDDCLSALGRLAEEARSRLSCRVIGVTGSTGKTSTKEMLGAVVSQRFKSLVSPRNFNNEIGVPLTILKAKPEVEVLVLEMGMRGPRQIAALASLAGPEVGIITNVGDTHYELLGSHRAIADAKSELVQALDEAGLAVLNADDDWTPEIRRQARARVVTFGIENESDVRATDIHLDGMARAEFRLRTAEGTTTVRLEISGRHQVYNALAAAATGQFLGMCLDEIAGGLAGVFGADMRMQLVKLANGATAINDAYNANPTSMESALATLAAMHCTGRKIAVLGDMAELGSLSDGAHFRIGEAAAGANVDFLLTVGERAVRIAHGAVAAGLPSARITTLATAREAAEDLRSRLVSDDLILIKASRVMALDGIVADLA